VLEPVLCQTDTGGMTAVPGKAAGLRRSVRWFAASRPGGWLFARVLHHLDRAAFKLTNGRRTLTSLVAGLPVIMLTTTGARTGFLRTVPVLGFPVDERMAIAAGNFGRQQEPAWCLNLRRDPHAQIVVDQQARRVVAEERLGETRAAVWKRCLTIYPGGAAYARRAAPRTIALFLLSEDLD
jgi:deazaflavin-dependent oxidoreductase (nitroreductase family)